jgi:outer membrane immunogenic protein
MKRHLIIALGLVVGPSNLAAAADAFEAAPALVPSTIAADWAGAFLGVSSGVLGGEFGYSDCCIGPGGWAASPFASLHAGYNWQHGGVVIGIETDITAFSLVAKGTGGVGDFSEKGLATFRGRIGTAFGNSLLYATAGLGLTYLETSNPGFASVSAVASGLVAGAGVETRSLHGLFALGDKWSARAEFLYVNVPKTRLTSGPLPTVGGSDNYLFRLGLNRYF